MALSIIILEVMGALLMFLCFLWKVCFVVRHTSSVSVSTIKFFLDGFQCSVAYTITPRRESVEPAFQTPGLPHRAHGEATPTRPFILFHTWMDRAIWKCSICRLHKEK